MTTFKRILSCLLVMAMLASMAVVVSAEEATSVFGDTVMHSVTTEDKTGLGLAFLITMNVKGAQTKNGNEFDNSNAIATVDGVEYKVVKMGAIMANEPADIANINGLTLEDANGASILDIPVKYMYSIEEDTCSFAVRIIKLPEQALGHAIACRPYVVLEGMDAPIYGAGDVSTYNSTYYISAPEETPALEIPAPVAIDDRLSVTAAAAEYVAYETETYNEAFKVNMTLKNVSTNAKTSVGDYIACSFKDAEGNVLGTKTVDINELPKGEDMDVEFYAPVGTATIVPTELNLNYVPVITLPAIGSDIDVTKKKNRIRVSATEASFNEDGTIHVALTFKNYTSNWITEETDYVTIKYYQGSTSKGTKKVHIGVIDTKKNSEKTYEFDVPAYVTKVTISASNITYWTEWA